MEGITVLLTNPMSTYLEHQLTTRFNLIKLSANPQPHLHSIRAVVTNASHGVSASLIDAFPNLEIVSSYSVGVDKIDLVKCRERRITVTNTPDVLTDDVADLAIGLAIATMRKICGGDRFVRSREWNGAADFGLTSKFSEKSLGIVGLGRIGSAIARRAEAFDCPISYHSRTEKPNTNYNFYPNIIDLATDSQILVIACSLTDQTRRIVNREVIDALGPKGILINVGRGAHIDEPELVSALLEGRLGGAGLDVFENEPEVPQILFQLENVVLSSHVGSDTVETCKDMADLVIANLEAHFSNNPVLTPVI